MSDLAKLTQVYVRIRDAKEAASKEAAAKDAEFKEKLNRIGAELLRALNDANVNSIRTDEGTVIRQEDILPRADDWSAFYDWIKKEDAFDALERRVKKTFVKEYMEANEGKLPPGISVLREFTVRVRRNSN